MWENEEEYKEWLKRVFPDGDIDGHKRYHEEEIEKEKWYKGFYRKILEKAVMSLLAVVGSWALLILYKHFFGV